MSRSETGAMAWARASLVRRVAEAAKATQKEGGICGRGGAATSVDESSAAGALETAVSSSGAQPAGADEERAGERARGKDVPRAREAPRRSARLPERPHLDE